jgi:hypothetical protein
MKIIDANSKVLGEDLEHQAIFQTAFLEYGVVVSLTISRDESDCADQDRYAICSGLLSVEDIGTGKKLKQETIPPQWEIHSSVYDYMIEAARDGDFDELIEVAEEFAMRYTSLSRQGQIQLELAQFGLRMEHSLASMAGEGHAIVNAATGEMVDGYDDLSPDVIALAEEWTRLEGPVVGEELAFTMGTGDGWNCHTDDGFGIRIDPVGGGKAWNWSAARSWMDGVGTGQDENRDDAVASAKQCLVDAGLNPDRLPVRQRISMKFEFDEAQFTLEALLEANAHDEELCKWARSANIGDSFSGCTRVSDGPVAVSSQDAKPALQWFTMEQAKPPEQKNVVAMLDSGIPILGRNIFGRFATLDPVNDRFVEWMEGHEDGFHGIKCWAEVIDPGKPENDLNSRILLAEALRYIESPEKVDVDWLAASILRHQNGLTLCERPKDVVSIAPVVQSVPGAVLAFPGMPEAEIDELVETLKRGGNTLFRLADDIAAPVLRNVAASAGLEVDEFHP